MKKYFTTVLAFIFSIITFINAQDNSIKIIPITNNTSIQNSLGSPSYQILNVNNISTWHAYNGKSNHTNKGADGTSFPRGFVNVIYQDGLVWGGKVFTDAGKTTPAAIQPVRVGGGTYGVGTKAGWINGTGANATAEPITSDGVKIYRIRRDFKSISNFELVRDAKEFFEVDSVSNDQINQVLAQYEKDWDEWPVSKGAPFIDRNQNGVYNAPPPFSSTFTYENLISGNHDEPGIAWSDLTNPADQVLFTIYNDLDAIQATGFMGSKPIGLEIQKTIWGYKRTDAIGNVYFSKYRLINKGGVEVSTGVKGAFTIDSMYLTQWSDPDLGTFSNDVIGCDTTLGIGFTYNSENNDKLFNDKFIAPASIGYLLLQGPVVPSIGNNATINFKKRNGYKNLGMSSFAYFAAGSPYSDPPGGASNYDNGSGRWWKMLRGFAPLGYFSTADVPYASGTFPASNYPLSGDPVARTGFLDGKGTSSSFAPGDRRLLVTTGPFSLAVNDTQEVVFAIIGGIASNNIASIASMKKTVETVKNVYTNLSNFSISSTSTIINSPQSLSPKYSDNYNPLNGIEFNWDNVENAVNYKIQFSSTNLFNSIISERILENNSTAFFNLPFDSKFYWRVQGINSKYVGPWSQESLKTKVGTYIITVINPGLLPYDMLDNNNPATWGWNWTVGERFLTWANADGLGFEGFRGTAGWATPANYFNGVAKSVTASDLKKIEFRFAPLTHTSDTTATFDNTHANVSKAYRYLRSATAGAAQARFEPFIINKTGGYAFQDFNRSVPLSVWNMDATPPVRLKVAFMENNVLLGLVDGQYVPPLYTIRNNTAGNGPREWLFVMNEPYSETASATATDILSTDGKIMYWFTWNLQNTNAWKDTDRLILTPANKKPIPVFPPSGMVDRSINELLIWKKIYGLNQYHLQLSTNNNFTELERDYVVTDSSKSVINLKALTKYYWRVQVLLSPTIGGLWGVDSFTTGIRLTDVNENNNLPKIYSLSQNYPNPFNPTTAIKFDLPFDSNTKLEIFNTLGQLIKTVIDDNLNAGYHKYQFNLVLPTGIYFYRITSKSLTNEKKTFIQTKKMVLLK